MEKETKAKTVKKTSSNQNKKTSTTKKTSPKKPAAKKTSKKTQTKKKNETNVKKVTKVATPVAKVKKAEVKVEVISTNNKNHELDLPKNVAKQNKVKKMIEVKRPEPKVKQLNKDEKLLFKKLEEAFTYVANMTWVIEEKTMDYKQIPDLTLGELHVVEMVNKNNNKPMSIIAKKLNVTVGSLITCVNRLIQKDYLIRTRDEMDHRVILLSVTPKAKKVIKVHDKFHNDILNLALEGISLTNATKVMSQFATVLDNYMNPKEEKKVQTKKTK